MCINILIIYIIYINTFLLFYLSIYLHAFTLTVFIVEIWFICFVCMLLGRRRRISMSKYMSGCS